MTTQGSTDGWMWARRLGALGQDEPVHMDTGQCLGPRWQPPSFRRKYGPA
jgi:hypothetical protein